MAASIDLPLITEATNDYYRNIYADPDLGPIFKGVNMVVLRTHVSYFIHQLTMFDTPMTKRQLDYLRKVHEPIIAERGVTQRHYDIMLQYLTDAMRTNGAEEDHLHSVKQKLLPLRDLFPPAVQSEDGHVVVQECPDAPPKEAACVGSTGQDSSSTGRSSSSGGGNKPAWLKKVLKAFKKPTRCPYSSSDSTAVQP